MNIKLAKTNREFLELYENMIDKYPERTQLFRANLTGDLDEPLSKDKFRGAVYQNGCVVLLFLNANPYNLQLFSTTANVDAVDYIAKVVVEENIDIVGVQGNKFHTSRFIEAYKKLCEAKFVCRLQMDIMRLDCIIKPAKLFGEVTKATMQDLPKIMEYMTAFSKEALHENLTVASALEKAKSQIDKGGIYLLRNEQNEVLSITMISRAIKNGRAISLVYTPDCYRNKGYSSSLLYQVCMNLFAEGNQFVTLFVDKTNPVSNRVYEKLGFVITEDSYDYVMKKGC